MGNKQSFSQKINKYKNVDIDIGNDSISRHSAVPNSATTLNNVHYSNSGHLPSINSTRTSSFSSDLYGTHRLSFTASHSSSSYGNYPDLAPLQNRIDSDILYLIINYMDILSRLQISICCKYFNKIILSEKGLSDVWIIHGLTHKKNTLWEVPMPNTLRYHRKINKTKSTMKNKKQHIRAASYSFSSGISSKKKKINIMGRNNKNKKRRQSTITNNEYNINDNPRSLPPEKIFGIIEDLKENEEIVEDIKRNNNNNNNNDNKLDIIHKTDKIGSISRSKSSSNRIINGKNLIISTNDDHGIVIQQQHQRHYMQINNQHKNMHKKKNKNNKYVMSINLRKRSTVNTLQKPLRTVKKRRYRHFFHELSEYNIVVADFKKYLLQFSPIIKYSRCLVVGADGLPKTLRDFSKLRWIPTVMMIEYLVLERNNDSIVCEIINSFAHSLKYLSIRGDIDESLYLYDLNIEALRICNNFNQSQCEYIWSYLPSTLKYLCLFKTIFNNKLLNKSFIIKNNLYKNLLHLSLFECTVYPNNTILILPPSLISLHIKKFQGQLSCKQCKKLWEIALYVDMKGYNQLKSNKNNNNNNNYKNVVNIAKLMESLEVCSKIIKQIVFYEYNNFDQLVLPNQLMFSDWKNVHNLFVVVPKHWLNDEKFKLKFENSTFTNIKMDIVYYYDEDNDNDDNKNNDYDDDDDDDDDKIIKFNDKEKEFRKELRQRVGYSMFADFYNNHNHNVGEFNLSKYVRNGHHQLTSKR